MSVSIGGGLSPHWRRNAAVAALGLLALWGLHGVTSRAQAASSTPDGHRHEHRDGREHPERGLVYRGLVKRSTGPCRGGFELVGQRGVCTAGPDPAPAGVDVRVAVARAPKPRPNKSLSPSPTVSPSPSPTVSPSPSPTATAAPVVGPWCGTEGKRVQLIYARSSDVVDRFDSIVASLQQYAAVTDKIVRDSAAETGGVRRIRYVTDGSCSPVIARATLSATGDDSFANTRNELKAQGYNRTDRKYLVWVDAGVYCGIANVAGDDTPGPTNRNNVGPTFGRVDRACWGGRTEAHELVHTLGGVQLSAPHTSGGWHCTDDYDRLCYQENGKVMTYPCLSGHEALLDCGHDDYFHTAPDPSSYLATHWNVANSDFLHRE
jgi:hypothetical protein